MTPARRAPALTPLPTGPGRTAPTTSSSPKPVWSVKVPEPTKGWLSANAMPGSYHVRATRVKDLRRAAYLLARGNRCPRLAQAHIVIVFHFATRVRRDVANLAPSAKPIIDGLVDAHLLPDDDDAHMTGPDLRTGTPVTPGRASYGEVLVYPPLLDGPHR